MREVVREILVGERVWVVGGAVRDELLGRPTLDLDLVVEGDPRAIARKVARATGAATFELSEAFGAWRVVGPEHAWQVDVAVVQGGTLATDLAARDLTVNAMAEPLEGGELIDPHGGQGDLADRKLRMVAPEAFDADPLRAVRVARLAVELGFDAELRTVAAARVQAPRLADVAQERVFAELKRIVAHPDVLKGLRFLDALGATEVLLPELHGLRGVQQSPYHHLDVHGHTLEVLGQVVALDRDPAAVVGDALAGATRALLDEPLADELTRGQALRLAALLHDAAKPRTRTEAAGRVGFPDHDRQGAEMAREALTRLRASERLRAHVAALVRHHLRLGFLVREAPLDRRGVHRYLVACAPVAADVTLLSIADRLATRGRNAPEAIARHLELARSLLGEALDQRAAGPPVPLVRGHDLARALGIEPGPELGQLLSELEEARFVGEVTTAEEAIAWARAARDAR